MGGGGKSPVKNYTLEGGVGVLNIAESYRLLLGFFLLLCLHHFTPHLRIIVILHYCNSSCSLCWLLQEQVLW